MSRLTDRLRGIVSPTRASLPDTAAPAPRSLEVSLEGRWVDAGAARRFLVERRVDRASWHGRMQLGEMADELRQGVDPAALLVSPDACPRLPFLFFDLETTGLSGGAGTYAFLVGCGWFDEEGGFVTHQHLLSRVSDERAMLGAVARQLGEAGTLVSFNGKSFDAPLLETRFSYHRLQWSVGSLPHLDVLHPARRFWRSETGPGDGSPSCSLGALERQVLGAHRFDDLPGFEAPGRYFQFIRTGDAAVLAGVLEHNRHDLLSLAGLTARLMRLARLGGGEAQDAREAVALGRLYERAGLLERAENALERSLTLPNPMARRSGEVAARVTPVLRAEALHALALIARRTRRYGEAARRWQALLDLPGCPRGLLRDALEALAIHHEHRIRDLTSAHAFARRTLDDGLMTARPDAVRHRLARLERKLGEAQGHLHLQLGE